MPKNIKFERHASANANSDLLNDLERRLMHPVFKKASASIVRDPKTFLTTSLQASSLYEGYRINASYIPAKGLKLDHIEISVDIADWAPDEIKTAIPRVLEDIFNYRRR